MKLVSFYWLIMFEWLIVVNVVQWLMVKLVIIRHGFQFRSNPPCISTAQRLNGSDDSSLTGSVVLPNVKKAEL
jgi:hypothetical protein